MMNFRKLKLTATISFVVLALITLETEAGQLLGFKLPKFEKTSFKIDRAQPVKQKDPKLLLSK